MVGEVCRTFNKTPKNYPLISTNWISAIGEELGMQQLPDQLLKKLAEDASYRLREVLHKCVARLRHSKKKRLTVSDVNAVVTNLCDADPLIGAPENLPEWLPEANLFVPHERFVDLAQRINQASNFTQENAPFLQEIEIVDSKLLDARESYAKRALKMLFNGSQKTFQVLLNDCATNASLGGEGVVDKLMLIARSIVISNNALYTRVSMRTCQLIIAITSNNKAVYPYHLNSVDKLTDLLLELLLGQGFIHSHLENLFKDCVLKLMLRWPSVANKFIPTLKDVIKIHEQTLNTEKKLIALELLAGVEPLIFLEEPDHSQLSLVNILQNATPGSNLWHLIMFAIGAFVRSGKQPLNYSVIIDHFGDSIIPLFKSANDIQKSRCKINLPIIIGSKIRYANIKSPTKQSFKNRQDMLDVFPDSTLQRPRREISIMISGKRPVSPHSLRRVNLRANYQMLRNVSKAPYALIASNRLLIFKHKRKRLSSGYNLARTHL